MSDRDTNVARVSTSYTSAPVKATEGSPYGEPPPYSVCVPYLPTANSSYPATHSPLPVNPSAYPPNGSHHQGYMTGNIQHGIASSAPLPDVTRGSENCGNAYVPRPDPYNPQPSYNPSYIPHRQNDPAANLYGRKTIVLQRTDAENIAQNNNKITDVRTIKSIIVSNERQDMEYTKYFVGKRQGIVTNSELLEANCSNKLKKLNVR